MAIDHHVTNTRCIDCCQSENMESSSAGYRRWSKPSSSYCGCSTLFWSVPAGHSYMSSVGTRFENTSIRIAVAPLCTPHDFICGAAVDSSGVHGLSCRKSAGRGARHTAINNDWARQCSSLHSRYHCRRWLFYWIFRLNLCKLIGCYSNSKLINSKKSKERNDR